MANQRGNFYKLLQYYGLMDSLHLPEIIQFREKPERCLESVNITKQDGLPLTGRRQTSTKEKRRSNVQNTPARKKRLIHNTNREGNANLYKASNTQKSTQPKTQNVNKRCENIGLPRITINDEVRRFMPIENCEAKKARTKLVLGETISYVYSKSLQDENTMAFLRNSFDFEKDLNVNFGNKKSSFERKKPYGLPALKSNDPESDEKKDFLSRDFSDDSETESILNAWEAIDDEDACNNSAYHSTDCSTGNED